MFASRSSAARRLPGERNRAPSSAMPLAIEGVCLMGTASNERVYGPAADASDAATAEAITSHRRADTVT